MAQSIIQLDTLDLRLAATPTITAHSKLSAGGKPLTIAGQVFERGIGSHANGCLRINLDGMASRFTAMVGVDDDVGVSPYTSVTFRVAGDGKTLWQSPVMKAGDPALEVNVDLTGIHALTLFCDDAGAFGRFDHADWAQAAITYAGSAPTITSGRFLLEMADTAVAFKVTGDKLYECYYGPRLTNAADYPDAGPLAYPTQLDASAADNAISLIQADGAVSLELVYRSHELRAIDANRSELICYLIDPDYPVAVELHYQVCKHENVMERWAVISNTGTGVVEVNHAASAFLNVRGSRHYLTSFYGAWGGEALMQEEELHIGTKELQSHTGTRTSQPGQPAFILTTGQPAAENSGEVIMGALAWSGNWRLRFELGLTNKVTVQAGYHPHLARYRLAKDESLTTPRLVLTRSNQGKGQASRNLHRWARAYGIRGGDEPRRILLNSWEGAYFTFDDELIKRMITDAAKTGIELFVLDDGWFGLKHPRNSSLAGLGDWMVNTNKLKDGIQGLIDHAKNEGIDFGIWVEPEMVNPASELFTQHPDWVIGLPHRPQRLQRTQLGLDLSNPAVQNYIYQAMSTLLGEHPGISYVKWDCNRAISDPGSNYLTEDRQQHLAIDYVLGYYEVLRRLQEKHPDVTFQACGSGGGRTDYGSLKYHHEAWTSDNTDPKERIRMQWSLNHIYPAIITAAHVTESPNHQTGRVTPIKYRFDVAMSGRLGFELRPERVPADDLAFSKLALAVYKDIRPIVQFGDLYRLRSPFEGDTASLMYVLPGGDAHATRAVLFAFTLGKDQLAHHGMIQLRGLDPRKNYQLSEINLAMANTPVTTYDGKTMGGDVLMTEGLTIPWSRGDYQSIVIQLTEKPATD